jgi:hypothetical protein
MKKSQKRVILPKILIISRSRTSKGSLKFLNLDKFDKLYFK